MNFNKQQIQYHLVNAGIAGFICFMGYFVGAGENMTLRGVFVSLAASLIIFATKFRDFWSENENEILLNNRLTFFNFI